MDELVKKWYSLKYKEIYVICDDAKKIIDLFLHNENQLGNKGFIQNGLESVSFGGETTEAGHITLTHTDNRKSSVIFIERNKGYFHEIN